MFLLNNKKCLLSRSSFPCILGALMNTNAVQPSTQSPAPKSRFRNFLENVLYIVIAAGLALFVQAFIARPFIVNGSSMDPTFKSNDYLIVDELTYKFREPARGDVVIFRAPPEPNKFYIKRIIGLPGETISINGTKVTIINTAHPDGFTLDESFIAHPQQSTLSMKIPEGQYFVMGDNRAGSYDSRSWGTLPETNIRGRAFLRLLPFKSISVFPGEESYE